MLEFKKYLFKIGKFILIVFALIFLIGVYFTVKKHQEETQRNIYYEKKLKTLYKEAGFEGNISNVQIESLPFGISYRLGASFDYSETIDNQTITINSDTDMQPHDSLIESDSSEFDWPQAPTTSNEIFNLSYRQGNGVSIYSYPWFKPLVQKMMFEQPQYKKVLNRLEEQLEQAYPDFDVTLLPQFNKTQEAEQEMILDTNQNLQKGYKEARGFYHLDAQKYLDKHFATIGIRFISDKTYEEAEKELFTEESFLKTLESLAPDSYLNGSYEVAIHFKNHSNIYRHHFDIINGSFQLGG